MLLGRPHLPRQSPRVAPASAPQPPVLEGEKVTLRPAVYSDGPRILEMLDQPEVAVWWGTFDLDRVNREVILPWDGSVTFVVEFEDNTVGLIQYWEEEDPEYRHAGMDIALDSRWQSRGLGSDTVRTLARYLFEQRNHHRLVIDPAVTNERAIRSYERVGFKGIGVMRRYELGDDGTWHDGLLMDLLPQDLK